MTSQSLQELLDIVFVESHQAPTFICELLTTGSYSSHYHSYEVVSNETQHYHSGHTNRPQCPVNVSDISKSFQILYNSQILHYK